MNHQQATQLMAIESYLLDELTPEERDQFEEHFFDCQECSTDLRATSGFMDAARKEFRLHPVPKPGTAAKGKSRVALLRPALVWAALAASLLVIAYQNVVVYPRVKTEIAALTTPEILPSLSLVNGNSRGGQIPAVTSGARQPFLLLLDIPAEDRFSSYTCLLYSPSGSLFVAGGGFCPTGKRYCFDTRSLGRQAAWRIHSDRARKCQWNCGRTGALSVHVKQP